jgi:carboxyl-terminal processing protease
VEQQRPAEIIQPAAAKKSKDSKKMLTKVALLSAGLFLMFGLGLLVGSDRISLNGSTIGGVSNSEDTAISTAGLDEIYQRLIQNYDGDIDTNELAEGLKRGAVAAIGDNYTEYLSPQETTDFNASLDGTFEGIGAELGKEGSFVVIVAPIKGAPAEKAGVKPQDIIIEIDGEDSTDISISEAVKRIRGEKGTDVKLTLIRDGQRVEVSITRATIDIPSVEWRIEDGVGIIELNRFGTDTAGLVRKAATEFVDQGISKVVLDMRGNPGGLLDQAVQVSDVWLPKGAVIVDERRGEVVIKSFTSDNDPILKDVETIVLINEGSASASEIVAGALRDNNVAKLVGQTSFGKGSVQQLIDLNAGGSLKVTIARWYTPTGKNIDKEGITPDEIVEVTPEDVTAERDAQLEKAKELLGQ